MPTSETKLVCKYKEGLSKYILILFVYIVVKSPILY